MESVKVNPFVTAQNLRQDVKDLSCRPPVIQLSSAPLQYRARAWYFSRYGNTRNEVDCPHHSAKGTKWLRQVLPDPATSGLPSN
ncbi:hypothetical protein DPMN_131713 [Dreissena polymorpha]|uniref:Uncharacterized protein n=1 Tax=Dreissena polymorpha TaxID=45954 RepID=A0A9D4JD27_DREPO|nr:hypothetical protein DPMN_131713 [Dreissena polymorpha]